ncbi:MAG: twin-arginine translocase TatA/TatE family subunit [Bowdeniella nasicola]|nr:twin-arginine translocase TatA/TatE family subunit [Bowdeniella nasicola]
MPSNIRPFEILIIVVVIIVIFGASKLPSIASNIGKSLKVFKKEVKELRDDDDQPRPADHYQATGGVRVEPEPYPGTRPAAPPHPGVPPTDAPQAYPGSQPGAAATPTHGAPNPGQEGDAGPLTEEPRGGSTPQ